MSEADHDTISQDTGRDDGDAVFKALADSTRRALLDALFARDGQTVQALCDGVPGMTRFGVMKHLGVLEAANLVTTRREGRTKLHHLNPVPIQQLSDRWIGKYARPFTRALVDLQHDLERPSPERPSPERPSPERPSPERQPA